jgi:hypothetical protein
VEAILGHIIDFVSANARWAPYLAFVFASARRSPSCRS